MIALKLLVLGSAAFAFNAGRLQRRLTIPTNLPSPWKYGNCYVDNARGRIITTALPPDPVLTVQSCITKCSAQGFTLSGMQFSNECYCGNQLVNGATVADSGCDMACAGDANQPCGGPNRMSVYTSTGNVDVVQPPSVQTTGLPGNWKYQGCTKEPGAARVLPYKLDWEFNNTVPACLNQCAAFGYPAAGLEFGRECWCGDISDVSKNGGVPAAETDCAMPCSGDASHVCGSPERLTLYQWTGDINVWHAPANTGRYEFLIGGLVVPLLATVGINNKVTFLEKTDTSPFHGNSTGAYELDISLVGNPARAWREMHVQTDVFCSASLILPDKAGRQINIGGWSLDSTKGIRMYTPDGVEGTNGTNDWQENNAALHLQRQRWYPSSVLLTNGSILVVGGEIGSNGAAEPSLEILPQPVGGPTYLDMEWLARTDPNNLYERVFVGYYNEARILDQRTFATVNQLPNMPGSVTNFLAGRTYPMEGTAVMLPQKSPYTDPVEIMVCGGATTIPTGGVGLDSCVRIQPEVANPTWVLERMPSRRVMPCMAALPDGTFLILNGARQGNAGFGLATDPNLNAVLYDPSQPPNQRFSILANTIVARLYHSEATLLSDGRVLVSGSDPQGSTDPGPFPEEFRIEVYVPPYLTSGLRQPIFTIANTDWGYGGTFQITVQLFQGTTSTMRVSLVAATSSTHGAIMGGRTLFPAFSCAGNTCIITAPPNAGVCPPGWFQLFVLDGPTPSHSKWVRIGGDPGRLGDWPQVPGFTVPGV